ncbi:hypothetical protein WA577_006945 [Blastocystis sp. JDR]
MEELKERGWCHSIGVSNFSSKKLRDLLSFCKIRPAMDQVELHPHLQQWELKSFCDAHNIFLTAYFPLGGAKAVNSTTDVPLMKDPVILKIAEAHKKSGVQVLVRWAIQRGTICIPKSNNPQRIAANAQVFDFELSEEEMQAIRAMDKRHRNCTGVNFLPSPCTLTEVWDGENVD